MEAIGGESRVEDLVSDDDVVDDKLKVPSTAAVVQALQAGYRCWVYSTACTLH